jgi:hypothetical protein
MKEKKPQRGVFFFPDAHARKRLQKERKWLRQIGEVKETLKNRQRDRVKDTNNVQNYFLFFRSGTLYVQVTIFNHKGSSFIVVGVSVELTHQVIHVSVEKEKSMWSLQKHWKTKNIGRQKNPRRDRPTPSPKYPHTFCRFALPVFFFLRVLGSGVCVS